MRIETVVARGRHVMLPLATALNPHGPRVIAEAVDADMAAALANAMDLHAPLVMALLDARDLARAGDAAGARARLDTALRLVAAGAEVPS
jgi:hypothetical protein